MVKNIYRFSPPSHLVESNRCHRPRIPVSETLISFEVCLHCEHLSKCLCDRSTLSSRWSGLGQPFSWAENVAGGVEAAGIVEVGSVEVGGVEVGIVEVGGPLLVSPAEVNLARGQRRPAAGNIN